VGIERLPAPTGWSFSRATSPVGPGRWVFIAGQIAMDPSTSTAVQDFPAQVTQCFDQIEDILASFAGGLSDLVQMTAYVVRLEDFPVYNEIRAARLRDALPASTAVQVAGLLAGAGIEIEGIAFVDAEAGPGAHNPGAAS
jgi:2-iminobutanoate/2-iminopropanoate deaminase